MGQIVITGRIICQQSDIEIVLEHIADHIALSRAEAGNIEFDICQQATDSGTFLVQEKFENRAAFDAHTKRTRSSLWWEKTRHIPRELTVSEE